MGRRREADGIEQLKHLKGREQLESCGACAQQLCVLADLGGNISDDHRAAKVLAADTKVNNNVYGLYLEEGGSYDGDVSLIKGNLEADVRKESDEMASQGKRVSRNVWQRIETGF